MRAVDLASSISSSDYAKDVLKVADTAMTSQFVVDIAGAVTDGLLRLAAAFPMAGPIATLARSLFDMYRVCSCLCLTHSLTHSLTRTHARTHTHSPH